VPSLQVSTCDEDGVRVLDLRGELDLDTEPVLRGPLFEAVGARPTVVLDGAGLTFVDSHGMRLLISALRESTRRAGRLIFACENPTVLRLFTLTGMDRTFCIVPDRRAALALEAPG
jgi:anti-anti-sigma factor